MIAPRPGGRRAAIWSALKPPQEMPHMPRLPSHQGCAAIQASTSSASSCSCCVYSSVEDPVGLARPAHVHPHGRVAVAREVRLALRVADGRPVRLAVREVLEDRRHRVVLGVRGQPDAGGQARAVGQRDPEVLDLPHLAGKLGADLHARRAAGSKRMRSRLYGSGIAGFSESISRAQPVPVEDRVGDDPRRHAVADPVEAPRCPPPPGPPRPSAARGRAPRSRAAA